MNTNEMRELTFAELEQVTGGAYKYCSHGPAGEGVYPDYVNCMNAYDYLQAMIGIAQGLGAR